MTKNERRFVVTTRSRLTGIQYYPLMLGATRRILDELANTPGADLSVSIIANRIEFWTISVWNSRHLMQEFMRSGAHGRFMWEVGDWLESFWLMRWRPEEPEIGTWNGHELALRHTATTQPATSVPPEVRDHILQAIPNLRNAFGPEGAPTYDHAPETRYQRDLVRGAAGVLVRLPAGKRQRTELGRLEASLRADDPDLLHVVVGRGQGEGSFLLAVWRREDAVTRFLGSTWMQQARDHWGPDIWACTLMPENEFGQWDGLRLRDVGWRGELGAGTSVGPGPMP